MRPESAPASPLREKVYPWQLTCGLIGPIGFNLSKSTPASMRTWYCLLIPSLLEKWASSHGLGKNAMDSFQVLMGIIVPASVTWARKIGDFVSHPALFICTSIARSSIDIAPDSCPESFSAPAPTPPLDAPDSDLATSRFSCTKPNSSMEFRASRAREEIVFENLSRDFPNHRMGFPAALATPGATLLASLPTTCSLIHLLHPPLTLPPHGTRTLRHQKVRCIAIFSTRYRTKSRSYLESLSSKPLCLVYP